MKNKILFAFVLIILVGGVFAVGVSLSNAKFTPTPSNEIRYEGVITFDCGVKKMNLTLSESDMDIDDDFEYEVKRLCQDEVSNVIDWTARKYKSIVFNGTEYRSFNETKLNDKYDYLDNLNEKLS